MVHGRASTTTSGLKHQQRCAVHRNSHRTSPLGSTTSFAVKARYVGSTDFQTRKNEQHCHYCGLFLCACLSCRFVSVRFVSCVSYLVGNNNGDHDDDDDFASSMPLALHLFAISRSRLINPVGSALLSFVVSAEADWKTGVAAISQTRRSVHQFVLFATTVCGVTIIIIIMFGFSALRFGALRLSRVLVLLRKTIHFAFPLSVGTSTLIVSSEVGGCLVGTRRATMMLRSQSQSYESHKTFANERTTFRVCLPLSLSLSCSLSIAHSQHVHISVSSPFFSLPLSLVGCFYFCLCHNHPPFSYNRTASTTSGTAVSALLWSCTYPSTRALRRVWKSRPLWPTLSISSAAQEQSGLSSKIRTLATGTMSVITPLGRRSVRLSETS